MQDTFLCPFKNDQIPSVSSLFIYYLFTGKDTTFPCVLKKNSSMFLENFYTMKLCKLSVMKCVIFLYNWLRREGKGGGGSSIIVDQKRPGFPEVTKSLSGFHVIRSRATKCNNTWTLTLCREGKYLFTLNSVTSPNETFPVFQTVSSCGSFTNQICSLFMFLGSTEISSFESFPNER